MPAMLTASHVYVPACFQLTESIVSAYVRLPNFTVDTPNISEMGRSLNSHFSSSGRSPDVIKHCTLAESPELDGSLPKSNGAIFGVTNGKNAPLKIDDHRNAELSNTQISIDLFQGILGKISVN